MLALRGIAKAYAKLSAIDLDVEVGQVLLLAGRNGAGKTTLLRIATGYLDPDAGTVTVDGEPMPRAQRMIGYLPENAPAPSELTPREHLVLRARLKGHAAAEVDRVMALVEIAAEAGKPIGKLSKGFRQRVGLADALLGSPKLLVLDEPTSGLDPVQTKSFVAAVAAARARSAVLISSHAVGDLATLATHVTVLRDGKLERVEAGGYRETLEGKVLEMLGT